MAECVGVPLWEHHNSFLAGLAFAVKRREPARIHDVVLWIRRAHRRCEAQELSTLELACARHPLKLLKLLLLAHVRWKKLGKTFFEIEICGDLVAKKAIAILDDSAVEFSEIAF